MITPEQEQFYQKMKAEYDFHGRNSLKEKRPSLFSREEENSPLIEMTINPWTQRYETKAEIERQRDDLIKKKKQERTEALNKVLPTSLYSMWSSAFGISMAYSSIRVLSDGKIKEGIVSTSLGILGFAVGFYFNKKRKGQEILTTRLTQEIDLIRKIGVKNENI